MQKHEIYTNDFIETVTWFLDKVNNKIVSLDFGDKFFITAFVKELCKEYESVRSVDFSKIYPVISFYLASYPGIKINPGRTGGVEKV
jgi:hypothetical protein